MCEKLQTLAESQAVLSSGQDWRESPTRENRRAAPRIFHFLSETEPFSDYDGGAISRWVANVERGDRRTTILCPRFDDTWGYPDGTVQRLPVFNWIRYRQGIWRRLRLFRPMIRLGAQPLISTIKPGDIVWIHNRPEFAEVLGPALRSRGARVVLHLHNSHLAHCHKVPLADLYVFCSAYLLQEARQAHPDLGDAAVLRNGADEQLFYPRSTSGSTIKGSEPLRLLFVGRLVSEKGVHTLVKAVRILNERDVPVTARIVGGARFGDLPITPYISEVQQLAPENVKFLGHLSGKQLPEEFANADVFCSPASWQEPLGIVNIEAMASRLPVVATDVGGVSELFQEGGAILVNPEDPIGLADKIELLARNPQYREHIAAEGYAAFKKRFRWRQIRRDFDGIVSEYFGA